MICPKCGSQNMDGVTFCGSCGAQLASYVPFQEAPKQNYSQQQFNQQPPVYGSYGSPSALPPKNWMTEAIIVTIVSFLCCCSPISWILGIIAIVKANSVNSEFARGNINEANSNAESAKKLTMWAAIIAVVFVILFYILYFAVFATMINQAGGLQELLNSMN